MYSQPRELTRRLVRQVVGVCWLKGAVAKSVDGQQKTNRINASKQGAVLVDGTVDEL